MNLVSRSQWGARSPRSTTNLASSLQRGLAFHWEGPRLGSFSHDKCAGKVRSIQAFHMDSRGWADIAYNWVVCPHGYTFEGRGWGKRSAANGTNNCNSIYHAVCYLGGEGDPFTEPAKGQFVAVRDAWNGRYGRQAVVVPHSSCVATACPGDTIRNWIKSGLPGGSVPAPVGVSPMYNPPLDLNNVVASLQAPGAGAWLLQEDGAVFAFHCPYYGAPNGKDYWGSRKAARLEPRDDGRTGYMVIASTGERYRYPV